MAMSLSGACALMLRTIKFLGESVPGKIMGVQEGTTVVVKEEGSTIGENKG